jgi:hypothetical protein
MKKAGSLPLPFLLTTAMRVLFVEPTTPANQAQETGAAPPTPLADGACQEPRELATELCRYFWAAALRLSSSMKSGSTPYPKFLAFWMSSIAG